MAKTDLALKDSGNQNSNLRSSLRILEEREQEHRETLLRLQSQIDGKSLHLQDLSRQIAEHSALVLEIETYSKTLDEIKGKLQEGRNRLSNLREEVGGAERHLVTAIEKAKAEERRMGDAKEEVSHFRQSVEFLTDRISNLRTEEAKLNSEIGRLNSNVEDYIDKIRNLDGQERDKKISIRELEKEIEKLLVSSKDKQDKIEELLRNEKNINENIEKINVDAEDKKRNILSLDARAEELENRVAQLQMRASEIEGRNESVRGEFASMQMRIGEKMAELSKLLEEREKITHEVREIAATRGALLRENDELNRARIRLREDIDNISGQKQESESQISLINTRLNELENQEKHKTETLKKMSAQIAFFEDKLISIRDNNAELEMKAKVLKDELHRHQGTLEQTKEQEREFGIKIENEKSIMVSLSEEKIKLQGISDELNIKQQSSEQEIQRLIARVREDSQKLSLLEGEVRSRREILHELDLEKSVRRGELDAVNGKVQALRNEEKELISRKTSVDTLLSTLQNQVLQTEKVICDISKRVVLERTKATEEAEKAGVAYELSTKNKAILEETSRYLQDLHGDRDRIQGDLLDLRRQTLEKSEELGELETLRQDKLLRIEELNKEILLLRQERDKEETSRLEAPDAISKRRLAALKESLLRLQTEIDTDVVTDDSTKVNKKAS